MGILSVMADNNKWLKRVVIKLNQLHMSGSEFYDVRWVFDWDDKLSSKDNLDNVSDEDRAIETLVQAKILKTRSDENWFRNQVLEAQGRLDMEKTFNSEVPKDAVNTVWGNWNTTDSAHREYDWLRFIDGFDYDCFMQFCETNSFSLTDREVKPSKNFEPQPKNVPSTPVVNTIVPHPLEPRHYSVRTGILTLSPISDVAIASKGQTKRADGTKYQQCLLMEKLFKSVKSIKSGVFFRTILSVNDQKIDEKMEKKIRNDVAEINKKIATVGGPKTLIKVQNKKVFVNSSYL